MPGFRAFGQTRCQKKDGRCFLTRRKARGTGRSCASMAEGNPPGSASALRSPPSALLEQLIHRHVQAAADRVLLPDDPSRVDHDHRRV